MTFALVNVVLTHRVGAKFASSASCFWDKEIDGTYAPPHIDHRPRRDQHISPE